MKHHWTHKKLWYDRNKTKDYTPVCIFYGIYFIGCLNTLRPGQNGRRFADDSLKCIFLNENVRISIKISLKFVPNGPINNISALVQKMAWRRPGDKPLSEPMMVSLPTHICVTRPQWVKSSYFARQDDYIGIPPISFLNIHICIYPWQTPSIAWLLWNDVNSPP